MHSTSGSTFERLSGGQTAEPTRCLPFRIGSMNGGSARKWTLAEGVVVAGSTVRESAAKYEKPAPSIVAGGSCANNVGALGVEAPRFCGPKTR